MRHRLLNFLALAVLCLLLLSGCGVETVLSPVVQESDGSLPVLGTASQVFDAPSDGLNRLSVGIMPSNELVNGLPRLASGATYEISYAPEEDTGYPDADFHNWSSSTEWLGELTGARSIGQSFLSRYPSLDGITLRVATYQGDLTPGEGRLAAAAAPVLRLPVDGKEITQLPGGSRVQVLGAAEGWANVRLDNGQTGYVALDRFASLPPPARHNDRDVTLRLYHEGDPTPIREATINAAKMHDNSHVTFTFDPLPDSLDARYRFTVSSSASTPGNAVTFRYSPADAYVDGTRYEGDAVAGGDLVFRPHYVAVAPLVKGALDDFVWSAQTNTLDGAFPAVANTAERALRLTIHSGDQALVLNWSKTRPPGGQPLVVPENSDAPEGGLVMNTGFRTPVAVGDTVRAVVRHVGGDAKRDPLFFAVYALLLLAVALWFVRALVPRLRHGR